MSQPTIAQLVTDEIARRNLSIRDFARLVGVSHPTISAILSGDTPSYDVCGKLAPVLRTSLDATLRAAGLLPPSSTDPLTEEAEHLLSLLSPDRREEAIRFIRYLATTQEGSTSELVTPRMAKPKPSQS